MLAKHTIPEEHKRAGLVSAVSSFGFFKSVKSAVSNNKILIVDDQSINRKLLARALADYVCITANDGQEAVEEVKKAAAKNAPFALILMDLEMPVMDGQAATSAIRALDDPTPIICVSTLITNQEQFDKLTSGMNGFLKKPVNKTELELMVNTYTRYTRCSGSSRAESKENTVAFNSAGQGIDASLSFWSSTTPIRDNILSKASVSPISLSALSLAASSVGEIPRTFATSVNHPAMASVH